MDSIKQPKSHIVQAHVKDGTVVAKLEFEPTLAQRYSRAYRAAQRFLDSEVVRLSEPLTPMRSKTLRNSAKSATRFGSGLVQYNTPYARYQYYGKVMVGRAPKSLTNRPLTYGVGQAKWFEAMKARNRSRLWREVFAYLVSKAKA